MKEFNADGFVETLGFLSAKVFEIPWMASKETAQAVLVTCPNLSGVFYNVTLKPPATIEMSEKDKKRIKLRFLKLVLEVKAHGAC